MLCTVIDDEPFALDLIVDYVKRTPFLDLAQCFHNPFKAIEYLNSSKVDLIFLDINMPELSGIKLIKTLHEPPMVIFTTAYPDYAAESYEYNAVDYLLKPIKYERFLKAVNKAASQIKTPGTPSASEKSVQTGSESSPIFIKSGQQQVKINPDDILYIEAAGNYMCLCTREKKVLALLTMKDILNMFPSGIFVRVHKSYIINLNHIEAVDTYDVVVAGKKIPIGITYREHFLNRINIR